MAKSHKVHVFRPSTGSERRRSGRPQLPAPSSAARQTISQSKITTSVGHGPIGGRPGQTPATPLPAASLGRQWPTMALARAVRHVLVTGVSALDASDEPAIAAYCGVLRLIAYCNMPPLLTPPTSPPAPPMARTSRTLRACSFGSTPGNYQYYYYQQGQKQLQ